MALNNVSLTVNFFLISLMICANSSRANLFTNTGHFPQIETFRDQRLRAIGELYDINAQTPDCTATLVAPDVIVTAAHCFYTKQGELRPNLYAFHLGALPLSKKFMHELKYSSVVSLTSSWWTQPSRDIAFAKLKKPVSKEEGIPAQISSSISMDMGRDHAMAHITAIFYNENYENLNGNWTSESCEPIDIYLKSYELTHNCSTVEGMSGAPLYVLLKNKLIVIGIHIGAAVSTHGTATKFDPVFVNRAVDGFLVEDAFNKYLSGELKQDFYCYPGKRFEGCAALYYEVPDDKKYGQEPKP